MYPQRASISLQGLDRRALIVGAISGPHSQLGALLWCHFTGRGLLGWQKHSGKVGQSTLASGGSEHAYSYLV